MDVGVRELKQHLSEYLRRVATGETLQITDRGVPVALITRVAGPDPLARAIDEGWVRAPLVTTGIGHRQRVRVDRRVLDVLYEDRGE